MNEDGQKIFESFWQEGEIFVAGPDGKRRRKGSVDLGRMCHDISGEIQMLNKRQVILQNAIEASSDCKAERVKDCRMKSLKK